MNSTPSPWPRLADAWWVYVLGTVALVLFPIGLVTRVRCGRCAASPLQYLFDLDSIGGLPRLFISGLFAATAVLGWWARRRCAGAARHWWATIAGIGAALTAAKLVSVHSTAKHWAPLSTFLVGVLLTAGVVGALITTGRSRGIAGARPIAFALAGYAVAALGLDVVTTAVTATHGHAGAISGAAATFIEELGEALTALLVLVTVRWQLPPGPGADGVAPGVGTESGGSHGTPDGSSRVWGPGDGDQEVRQQ